jgi:hypothetical protein
MATFRRKTFRPSFESLEPWYSRKERHPAQGSSTQMGQRKHVRYPKQTEISAKAGDALALLFAITAVTLAPNSNF